MKRSKSDMAITPSGDNIFENATCKGWVKKNLRVTYLIRKKNVYQTVVFLSMGDK